MSTNFTDEEI